MHFGRRLDLLDVVMVKFVVMSFWAQSMRLGFV